MCYRVAFGGALEVDVQGIRRLRRYAVFVDAQQGHVEAPAWELEVVHVAAILGGGNFRRERQAHVGVALVLVQPVLPALVKAHGLALARARLRVCRSGGFTSTFQLRQRLFARVVGFCCRHAANRGLYLRRHVLHGDQNG